jgi:hypothetical protein
LHLGWRLTAIYGRPITLDQGAVLLQEVGYGLADPNTRLALHILVPGNELRVQGV